MKRTLYHERLSQKAKGRLRRIGLTLLLLAAGCPSNRSEKIVMRGSNTVGEELTPRLVAEYQKEHPAVTFDLEFKGTSYGVGTLMAGRCDIAAASREVTTNEVELARDREITFNDYVIGSYAVSVIVNPSNTITNLTKDQVQNIFVGTVKNWKDVGGPDAPIHIYIRDPISGTYLGFQELAMEKKPYAHGLLTFTNYAGIVQAVAMDHMGIGYASIEDATRPGIRAVSIGGAAPTVANVNGGQYPYARELRFYTNKANESSSSHQFIQYVLSPAGQKILDKMGYVPRP